MVPFTIDDDSDALPFTKAKAHNVHRRREWVSMVRAHKYLTEVRDKLSRDVDENGDRQHDELDLTHCSIDEFDWRAYLANRKDCEEVIGDGVHQFQFHFVIGRDSNHGKQHRGDFVLLRGPHCRAVRLHPGSRKDAIPIYAEPESWKIKKSDVTSGRWACEKPEDVEACPAASRASAHPCPAGGGALADRPAAGGASADPCPAAGGSASADPRPAAGGALAGVRPGLAAAQSEERNWPSGDLSTRCQNHYYIEQMEPTFGWTFLGGAWHIPQHKYGC